MLNALYAPFAKLLQHETQAWGRITRHGKCEQAYLVDTHLFGEMLLETERKHHCNSTPYLHPAWCPGNVAIYFFRFMFQEWTVVKERGSIQPTVPWWSGSTRSVIWFRNCAAVSGTSLCFSRLALLEHRALSASFGDHRRLCPGLSISTARAT